VVEIQTQQFESGAPMNPSFTTPPRNMNTTSYPPPLRRSTSVQLYMEMPPFSSPTLVRQLNFEVYLFYTDEDMTLPLPKIPGMPEQVPDENECKDDQDPCSVCLELFPTLSTACCKRKAVCFPCLKALEVSAGPARKPVVCPICRAKLLVV
jgi:hypothetical protein